MSDERPDSNVSPERVPLLAAARRAHEESRLARSLSERTRWRVRKERLRARRLRRSADSYRARTLDDFVEVASVDELVEVLVLLAERGDDHRPRRDRRLGA